MEIFTLSLPRVYRSGGFVQATAVKLRKGGVLVTPSSMWKNISGVWTKLWDALSISINASVTDPGGTIRRTVANLTATIVPTSSIEAWSWVITNDIAGKLEEFSVAATSAVFRGPEYNNSGFKLQSNATVRYTIVVGGQSYFKDVAFSYTYGDL